MRRASRPCAHSHHARRTTSACRQTGPSPGPPLISGTCQLSTKMIATEPRICTVYRTSIEMLVVTAFCSTCTSAAHTCFHVGINRVPWASVSRIPSFAPPPSRGRPWRGQTHLRVRRQAAGQLARARLVEERNLLVDDVREEGLAHACHDLGAKNARELTPAARPTVQDARGVCVSRRLVTAVPPPCAKQRRAKHDQHTR